MANTTNSNTAILTSFSSLYTAKKFLVGFENPREDYPYFWIGRPQPWPDDQAPPSANNAIQSIQYDYWRNMLNAKEITEDDIEYVIPRVNWNSGTVYTQYDDKNAQLSVSNFYILTPSYNVYKCLYNNFGSPSTVMPAGQDIGITQTSDGYLWKFLYEVDTTEQERFLTPSHMPVKTLTSDDNSAQWDVQTASTNTSIDVIQISNTGANYDTHAGQVELVVSPTVFQLDSCTSPSASTLDNRYVGSVVHIDSGTGEGQLREVISYNGLLKQATVNTAFSPALVAFDSTYSIAPHIRINGDGSGASAVANVTSNNITNVLMITGGDGYTKNQNFDGSPIVVATSNGGHSFECVPIISPLGGHGSDARNELFGDAVMIFTKFQGSESNTVTTDNDYRQYGIVLNPAKASSPSSVYTDPEALQALQLTVSANVGVFSPDLNVTGLTSGAQGAVVDYDLHGGSLLHLVEVNGAFQTSETLQQSNTLTTATVDSIREGDMLPYSGECLFISNREPILRANNQQEIFHVVFQF